MRKQIRMLVEQILQERNDRAKDEAGTQLGLILERSRKKIVDDTTQWFDYSSFLTSEQLQIHLSEHEQGEVAQYLAEKIGSVGLESSQVLPIILQAEPMAFMPVVLDLLNNHLEKLTDENIIQLLTGLIGVFDYDQRDNPHPEVENFLIQPKTALEALVNSTNSEVAELAEIVLNHLQWYGSPLLVRSKLKKNIISGADLRNAPLEHLNLRKADLRQANVQGARLVESDLQEANLSGINLQKTDLSGSNLQNAILIDSNLCEAHLIGVNLQGANLIRAKLNGAILIGANLQGAELRAANLLGVDFSQANLQQCIIENAQFSISTRLPNGRMWTVNADLTIFTNVTHSNAWQGFGLAYQNLQNADLSGQNLENADMIGAELQYVNLTGTNLENADMRVAKLQYANLSGANLRGANLMGANLRNAVLDQIEIDENTTLPNNEKWTDRIDLRQFTNP